jgi:D-alanyl-D-alanine carboxypeptidase (penicillin-binding protein 5/6)
MLYLFRVRQDRQSFKVAKITYIYLILCFPVYISAQIFTTPAYLELYLKDAPEIISRAAVLIDIETGALLYSKNINEEIPPASLTKLMTMHLLMKEIEKGSACYDELIPITVESWAQSQPRRSSLMFLEPGQTVTLREIMLGLAVSSGNDAAVAAALRLAPSMADFSNMMTAEARRMGLNVTRFTEASGISAYNMTTAEEFALFCRQYIKMHPHSLKDFHSVQRFSYPLAANVIDRRRTSFTTVTQDNQNVLLRTFSGVDGLKTGFIGESGYNIALTAERDQTRFVLVVLGAPSERGGSRIRAADSMRILSWAFENFKTVRPVVKNIEKARLWKGREDTTALELAHPADFTAHVSRADSLMFEVVIPQPLVAPLPAGFFAGYLVISDTLGEIHRAPLVTANESKRGNIFKRIWHSILLLFSS